MKTAAQSYEARNEIIVDFDEPLGSGTDGSVWRTNRNSVIKVFERNENYCVERECYQRLLVQRVFQIDGFAIPKLLDIDDELLVVEMGFVSPPFILDFGKCYLDRRPDFSAEVMADWEAEQRELWEDRWPAVQSILAQLEQIGIYYQDVKPGNIMFAQ